MKDVNYYQSKIYEKGWEVSEKKENLKISVRTEEKSVGVLVEGNLDI